MNKTKIGLVTEAEKLELLNIYERRNSLSELILTLNDTPCAEISIEDVLSDIEDNENNFKLWWIEKSKFYNWISNECSNWMIDFKTNEVFISNNY